MARLTLLLFLGILFTTLVQASKQPAKKPANPVLAPIEDIAGLPRVLLIGDSISMGYTLNVREMLKDQANVHRPSTNCGPTTNGVKNLDAWLGDKKWDVIHFNFGLHDLKYINDQGKNTNPKQGKVQVSVKDYEANLETMIQKMQKTGAKLIFATTTPVPEGEPQRIADSDQKYNSAALAIMKKHNITVNDLNAFVRSEEFEGRIAKNVHFTKAGSLALAKVVVEAIKVALKTK